ncbi:hypothetical protein BGX23_005236, partial [Mortierella sp. AD031]
MALNHPGFAHESLPTEILLKIGEMLNGDELYAALQVSRTWKFVLSPLLWVSITELQWQHRSFPFRHLSPVPDVDDTVFRHQLLGVKILAWTDTTALHEQHPTKIPESNEDLPINRLLPRFAPGPMFWP